jgi:DHA1 family bicyclomycin/chloramphenicol resistance-like MFS transporter
LFGAFFCIGILFGNINSMAMLPLGQMAGIGAAIIGSLSTVFSVPTAVLVGSFVEESVTPIAVGFVVFGSLSLIFFWFAERPQN